MDSNLIQKSLNKIKRQSNLKTIEKYNAGVWMKTHGKLSDLHKREKEDLKRLFNELDSDRSGLVSAEELFEMLMSLGIVSRKSEVEELMQYVSNKSSGVLKFDEFAKIFVKNNGSAFKQNSLNKLIKSVAGNLKQLKNRDLPLSINLCNRKRSLMMQAYVGDSFIDRDKGMKIISAFASEKTSPKSPTKEERKANRQLTDSLKQEFTHRAMSLPKKENELFLTYLPPINIRKKQINKDTRVELMSSFNSLNKY